MARRPLDLAALTDTPQSAPAEPERPQLVAEAVDALPLKPKRTTVDLPPDEHEALLRWCIDATSKTGGRRVYGQQVMRALVRRLLKNPTLAQQIIADLRKS